MEITDNAQQLQLLAGGENGVGGANAEGGGGVNRIDSFGLVRP